MHTRNALNIVIVKCIKSFWLAVWEKQKGYLYNTKYNK